MAGEDETGINAINVLPPHSETPVVFQSIPMPFMHQYKDLAIMFTMSPEGARVPMRMFEMRDVVPVEQYDEYSGAFVSVANMLDSQFDNVEYGVDFQRIVSSITANGSISVTMEEIFPREGCEPRQSTITIPVPVIN
jgi:hypothetical protein